MYKNITNLLNNEIFASTKYFTVSRKHHYDMIVAGGGMVGTTLACTLGKNNKLSNKKILLLESSKQTKWTLPEKYSNRVSSLSPATYKLLNDINAWKHIEAGRFGTIKRMQVWDAVSDVAITFDKNNLEEIVAYVVENDLLLGAVRQELGSVNNVDVVYESKISSCSHHGDDKQPVLVTLDNGTTFTCNLLLGCDGANSLVRRSMGFHYISHSYDHMGIVATLKIPEDSENVVAWQRQLPNSGFLALLPLRKGLSSLVWSTNKKEAKELSERSDEEFVDALNDAIVKSHPRCSLVDQATKTFDNFIRFLNLPSSSGIQYPPKILGCESNSRAAFPLGLGHATNYVGNGVVLVGDAAHRIHPLAGQGVNLGFGDIICLNKVLGEIVYSGGKLEDVRLLKQYETERQRYNIPIMLTVHGLFQLYSTQFTPLVLLRSLGLQATHACNPLKKLLISQASG